MPFYPGIQPIPLFLSHAVRRLHLKLESSHVGGIDLSGHVSRYAWNVNPQE